MAKRVTDKKAPKKPNDEKPRNRPGKSVDKSTKRIKRYPHVIDMTEKADIKAFIVGL
jgi:hypothetical protein